MRLTIKSIRTPILMASAISSLCLYAEEIRTDIASAQLIEVENLLNEAEKGSNKASVQEVKKPTLKAKIASSAKAIQKTPFIGSINRKWDFVIIDATGANDNFKAGRFLGVSRNGEYIGKVRILKSMKGNSNLIVADIDREIKNFEENDLCIVLDSDITNEPALNNAKQRSK